MYNTAHFDSRSAFLGLINQFDTFDGACDPAFDNDLDELERQFAELRLSVTSEFN